MQLVKAMWGTWNSRCLLLLFLLLQRLVEPRHNVLKRVPKHLHAFDDGRVIRPVSVRVDLSPASFCERVRMCVHVMYADVCMRKYVCVCVHVDLNFFMSYACSNHVLCAVWLIAMELIRLVHSIRSLSSLFATAYRSVHSQEIKKGMRWCARRTENQI